MPCGHSDKNSFHSATHNLLKTDYNCDEINDVRELQGVSNLVDNDMYTSYLGKVNFQHDRVGDVAHLQTLHKVANMTIGVKIVDYKENRMDINKRYTLRELVMMKTKKVNVKRNKIDFIATLLVNKKISQLEGEDDDTLKYSKLIVEHKDESSYSEALRLYPDLQQKKSLKQLQSLRKTILSGNSSVDIMFNTINYLDFLYKSTGMISVNNLNVLVSICNVPDLDNAFFTGKYMVYGLGERHFNPLVSIDVIGHELSHGLVSGTAGLVYQGHSGALNESFADIMGTMFEFYMYKKFNEDDDKSNDILGEADWEIGEDLGVNMPYLRDMKNPESARQPSVLNGKYYMDPNSKTDHGGVHINSGIPNKCFYVACKKSKNKTQTLSVFIKCLKKLSKDADFSEFSQTLFDCAAKSERKIIYDSLELVGLSQFVKLPAPTPTPTHTPTPTPTPTCPPCEHNPPCHCQCCFCKSLRR